MNISTDARANSGLAMLPDLTALLERLEALEISSAHQDQLVAELNEVVTGQWDRIEALERQIRQLRQEIASGQAGADAPDRRPPHY